MANKPANLTEEERHKLEELEKKFSNTINKNVILVAYQDQK